MIVFITFLLGLWIWFTAMESAEDTWQKHPFFFKKQT